MDDEERQDDAPEEEPQDEDGENDQGVSQPGAPGRGARVSQKGGRIKNALKEGARGLSKGKGKNAATDALKGFRHGSINKDDEDSKHKRPSLRQIRRFSKMAKGLKGAGGAAGGGAAAGGEAVAAGAAAAGAGMPVALIVLIVVFVIILLFGFIFMFNNPEPSILSITKTGPETASSGEEITYQINVSYPDTAENIIIKDRIPSETDYVSSSPSARFDASTRTATWSLSEFISPINNVNTTLNISLRIKDGLTNVNIINLSEGEVIGGGTDPGTGTPTGDIAKLLPQPLPPDSPSVLNRKSAVILSTQNTTNKEAYEKASLATGLPWQVFAGIHYREGGAAPNKSIVSGRTIGSREPDVENGPGCSVHNTKGATDGLAEKLSSGGCGFSSLADSAIYAGILLKKKVNGNLNSYEDLVKALSRYNGGGNANCGKTPYTGCPKLFYGEDDTYVVNLFDEKHATMYVVYCADHTLCNPPKTDSRPGAATAIKWVSQSN